MTTPVDAALTVADGVRIAYRDHGGQGRGLILLHGVGANLVSMDQYADRLGADRRTVALDHRACGQSGDPEHFRLTDAASDVAAVAAALDLGPVDVVGHYLGGFVGGWFASAHPDARLVSIDGFGPGQLVDGDAVEREEFRRFQGEMRGGLMAMTEPPEEGDAAWRDAQFAALLEVLPAIGYTAPNAEALAARQFVDRGDGTFRRHPARRIVADVFGDDGEADVLRMYRGVRCPTLIIRCIESGAPAGLDRSLASLAEANPLVEVQRVAQTHLGPAWDGLDEVCALIDDFFERNPPEA